MINKREVINIYSDVNTWIDIIIVPYEQFEEIQKVIEVAYDNWWNSEGAESEPIGDWICRQLDIRGFNGKYDIYFREQGERV